MDYIENRTFDEIQLGDTASLVRTLGRKDIDLFAVMSGDVNPAHVDEDYARSDMFHKIIAHGMWGGALISTLLGTKLPGPGTIYISQTLRFQRPIALGDTITVKVEATTKNAERRRITFECSCTNQQSEVVISGSAEVIAPSEKVKRPRAVLPEVILHEHGAHYQPLIELAQRLEPIRTAVIYPIERAALLSAIDAAQAGLIEPVLLGPEDTILSIAAAESIDLSGYTIIAAEHSAVALTQAIAMARAGEVGALMQGTQHTDELMYAAVAPATGLATERRMSHVFMLDVPTYPQPLFLTDAVLNINPELEIKRAIVQNAIDLAQALGLARPRVAILAASERVSPQIRSTLDAAALCKMAERGQISGGVLEGPLEFDNAISTDAARAKGLGSPVAGQADILVVPDVEAGNMLVKQLEHLAHAQAAGVVLGARVPILLNRRANTSLTRMASCALAVLLAHSARGTLPASPW